MYKPKPPQLVTIAVITTITLIFWVFFGLYEILTKKTEVDVPPALLEELTPTLDTTTLNQIQNRLYFEEGQVDAIPKTIERQ